MNNKALLSVFVLTLICCASCKKDKETEMVTLKLALEQPTDPSANQKVYLDDQKLVCWYKSYDYTYGAVTQRAKEFIRINDSDSSEVENNTASVPSANTYTAVYPHRTTAGDKNLANNGSVTVTIPAVQKYIPGPNGGTQNLANLPMGAYLDPSESGVPPVLMFRNLASLVKVTVENPSASYSYRVNSIKLSSSNGQPLHGKFTYTFSHSTNNTAPGTPTPSGSQPDYNSEVMLDFNHAWETIPANGSRVFYIVVAPLTAASSFRIEVRGAVLGNYPNNSIQNSEAIKVHSKIYSGSKTLARSHIGDINAALRTGTGYTVSGGFYVGSKQSYFSIANLMIGYNEYNQGTWYFRGGYTPEQYDIEGSQKSYACWFASNQVRTGLAMDLFYYGGNFTNPNDPRTVAPSVSTYFPFADASVYSEDGSNNIWRCPSKDEYKSILFTRSVSNSLNARYAKAKIGNKAVLVLFPDDYQQPDGIIINNINDASTGYNHNILTYAQWKLMEAAGAIVLPTTGQIANTAGWQPQTSQDNTYGTYWTSDYVPGNPYGNYMYFNTSTVTTDYGAAFYAIRLIRD